MTGYRRRDCPLCGAPSSRAVQEVRAAVAAEDLDFEQVRDFWRGFRKEQCFFSFHRCGDCELLYSPIYFTDDELSTLYGDMPDNTHGVDASVLGRTQQGYFTQLDKHGNVGGTLLELGPDIGLFTQAAVKGGSFDRVLAVEPNVAVHDEFRQRIAPTSTWIGTDVKSLPEERADTEVFIHVLDHLIDPVQTLLDIAAKTEDPGTILVVVHNEASLLRKVLSRRWPPFCLQHPQLYNPKTLSRLLARAGFPQVDVARATNYFPPSFLLRSGVEVLGLPARLALPLPSKEIPLKLGNLIAVGRA